MNLYGLYAFDFVIIYNIICEVHGDYSIDVLFFWVWYFCLIANLWYVGRGC